MTTQVETVELVRTALQALRDGWVEPYSHADFSADDVAEVMATLEEIEGIVEGPSLERDDDDRWVASLFDDAQRHTLVEVDRRGEPDPLLVVLSVVKLSDIYASVGWCAWAHHYLAAQGLIDVDPWDEGRWRSRIRKALDRDMIVVSGAVPDGPHEGAERLVLTERGILELQHWESDHPRIVRE